MHAQHRKNRRRQWGKAARKLWFLWDPPGMVIAGFAWCIMGASLLALWTSISRWFGLFSPAGLLAALWFSSLMGMCLWSHFAVVTTNPGTVPAKLTGVAPSKKQEAPSAGGDVDLEEDEDDEDDEDDYEEVEVEIPLTELESQEDDGSLLLFCDECAIYKPARYALASLSMFLLIMANAYCHFAFQSPALQHLCKMYRATRPPLVRTYHLPLNIKTDWHSLTKSCVFFIARG